MAKLEFPSLHQKFKLSSLDSPEYQFNWPQRFLSPSPSCDRKKPHTLHTPSQSTFTLSKPDEITTNLERIRRIAAVSRNSSTLTELPRQSKQSKKQKVVKEERLGTDNREIVSVGEYMQFIKGDHVTKHKENYYSKQDSMLSLKSKDWANTSSTFKKVNRDMADVYEILQRKEVDYHVGKIVSFYRYFKNYGYSDAKITALVRSYCKGRLDIQRTFLRIRKMNLLTNQQAVYQHRSDQSQILQQIFQTMRRKKQTGIEQYFYHFFEFRDILEKDIIERGCMKIEDLGTSIVNESVRIGQKQTQLRRSCEGIRMLMQSRKGNKHMRAIDEDLKVAEGKCGVYRHISDVNRKLYAMLITKEKNLNERINKGISQSKASKQNPMRTDLR